MEKCILIPTDFSIESLLTLKKALLSFEDQDVSVVLFYSTYISDSISDLLFHSKMKELENLENKSFKDACEILKNKYQSKIKSFKIELFTGLNQNAFNNFIQAHKVSDIFIPKNYKLKMITKRSFDPINYIKKNSIVVHEVEWKEKIDFTENIKIAELFLD
jgi:hypothetical protein